MSREKVWKVALAPNEDGLGTSAWTVRLVKELVYQCRKRGLPLRVVIVVASENLRDWHQLRNPDPTVVDVVKLNGIDNPIKVVPRDGRLDENETIKKSLFSYTQSRREYQKAIDGEQQLAELDVLLDLGVPQLVSALRKRLPKLLILTLFDHAWSLTLRRIADSVSWNNSQRRSIKQQLLEIEQDEKLADVAYVFDDPVAGPLVRYHWAKLLGQPVIPIPGVFGGPLSTLEWIAHPAYEDCRDKLEQGLACPRPALEEAKRFLNSELGLDSQASTVYVSGAGTSVWENKILRGCIEDFGASAPDYNVVVFARDNFTEHLGVTFKPSKNERLDWGRKDNVLFIRKVRGDTHHVLFAGFDTISSRAGGGTVSDAIAFRRSLLLVQQPGHWQVEQIRMCCLAMDIAHGETLNNFMRKGRQCIQTHSGKLKQFHRQTHNMGAILQHREIWLIREVFQKLGALQ